MTINVNTYVVNKYISNKKFLGVTVLQYKKIMIVLIIFVSLFAIGAVGAVDNITVDGDSVIDGEVEMPTERLEVKFNDTGKTLTYNVFDEALSPGQTNDLNYDYKVNNKTCSGGQGFISNPSVSQYGNTLKYYEDGEHNLIIHRNYHGTKTLLFNVTFNVDNNVSLSDNIILQNTKTVKYSIKNGVVSGSFPEEYRTLHEGWNNLTEYSLLNTGSGSTKPVILKVFYRPYIINNTDIRIIPQNSTSPDEKNDSKIIEEDYYNYDEYNAKIIAKDVTLEYSSEDYEITIYIEDNNHNPIEMAEPYLDDYLNSEYDEKGYYHFFPMYLDVGTHNIEFTLDDGLYKAQPVSINLTIVPSTFYGDIKCKSYYGTDKSTLTMKATVYDPDADCYENGYVTFKVNGKSYNVKTKNGVATKSIKIKKAGTYTYTAKFTNNNYKSSATGKAKLFVYSTSKKARTFNIKGYKFTMSVNQYSNLVKLKNTGKTKIYKIKTNKKIKQTYEKVSYSYKWKYVKTVSLVYAHEKCYYNSNYKYNTIKTHWISDGEYYQTCKLYKKVEVEKVSYKKVNSRVYAWVGYALDGQAGHDKYWIEIMTDNSPVIKGKLHWEVKSSTLTGLKTAKPKDMKNFSMR